MGSSPIDSFSRDLKQQGTTESQGCAGLGWAGGRKTVDCLDDNDNDNAVTTPQGKISAGFGSYGNIPPTIAVWHSGGKVEHRCSTGDEALKYSFEQDNVSAADTEVVGSPSSDTPYWTPTKGELSSTRGRGKTTSILFKGKDTDAAACRESGAKLPGHHTPTGSQSGGFFNQGNYSDPCRLQDGRLEGETSHILDSMKGSGRQLPPWSRIEQVPLMPKTEFCCGTMPKPLATGSATEKECPIESTGPPMRQFGSILPVPRTSDVFSATTNRISISSFTSQITNQEEHNSECTGQLVRPHLASYPAAVDLNGTTVAETKGRPSRSVGSGPTCALVGDVTPGSVISFDDDVNMVLKSLGGWQTGPAGHSSGHGPRMRSQNGMNFTVIYKQLNLCLTVVRVIVPGSKPIKNIEAFHVHILPDR